MPSPIFCAWRCGLFRPFHAGVVGPVTIVPSGLRTLPASRSYTYSRNLSFGCLRALRGLLCLALRDRGPVLLLPAAGGGVAPQLA